MSKNPYDDILSEYFASTKSTDTPASARGVADYKPRTLSTGNPQYDAWYDTYGKKHNVDPDLLIAQGKQESRFRSNAKSPAGAQGIAQFMPATAKEFGVNPADPESSINGQSLLMGKLLDRTKDPELALAGYNSGHNASIQRLRRNRQRIPETKGYVDNILGTYKKANSPQNNVGNVSNNPYADILDGFFQQDTPQDTPSADIPQSAPPPTNPVDVMPTQTQLPPPPTPMGVNDQLVPEGLSTRPAPESPDTLKAQMQAALNPKVKDRSAVLTTEPSQNAIFQNSGFTPIQVQQGTLWVNPAKARKLKLRTPQDIQMFVENNPDGMTRLIGKVENVGDNTGGNQPVVHTTAPDGTELSSSVVTNPEAAAKQVDVDKKSFPDSRTQVTTTDQVALKRQQGTQATASPQKVNFATSEPTISDVNYDDKGNVIPDLTQQSNLRNAQVSVKDAGSTIADQIDIPDNIKTLEGANKYVVSQLKAKYGDVNIPKNFTISDWQPGRGATVDFNTLKSIGVDTDAILAQKVAENRVENPELAKIHLDRAVPNAKELGEKVKEATRIPLFGYSDAPSGLFGGLVQNVGDFGGMLAGSIKASPSYGAINEILSNGGTRPVKAVDPTAEALMDFYDSANAFSEATGAKDADGKDTIPTILFKGIGQTPEYAMMSALPGGLVTGIPLKNSLLARAKDKPWNEVVKETGWGIGEGALFTFLPKGVQKLFGVDTSLLKTIGRVGTEVAGISGGTYGMETLKNPDATPEDKLKSAISIGLFHLYGATHGSLKGDVAHVVDAKNNLDAYVKIEGPDKFTFVEKQKPDLELAIPKPADKLSEDFASQPEKGFQITGGKSDNPAIVSPEENAAKLAKAAAENKAKQEAPAEEPPPVTINGSGNGTQDSAERNSRTEGMKQNDEVFITRDIRKPNDFVAHYNEDALMDTRGADRPFMTVEVRNTKTGELIRTVEPPTASHPYDPLKPITSKDGLKRMQDMQGKGIYMPQEDYVAEDTGTSLADLQKEMEGEQSPEKPIKEGSTVYNASGKEGEVVGKDGDNLLVQWTKPNGEMDGEPMPVRPDKVSTTKAEKVAEKSIETKVTEPKAEPSTGFTEGSKFTNVTTGKEGELYHDPKLGWRLKTGENSSTTFPNKFWSSQDHIAKTDEILASDKSPIEQAKEIVANEKPISTQNNSANKGTAEARPNSENSTSDKTAETTPIKRPSEELPTEVNTKGVTAETSVKESGNDGGKSSESATGGEKPSTKAGKVPEALKAFEKNKIFTPDAVAKARERLAKKGTQFNAGLDPETLHDLGVIGGAYIEAGARNFGEFASKMKADIKGISDDVLKQVYELVHSQYSDKIPNLEAPEGGKERRLPQTLEAGQLEKGTNLTYEPQSIASGEERGRQIIAEKGIDGAKEFVRNGNGIEWASTGYAVMEHQVNEIAEVRKTDPARAEKLYAEHVAFVDEFVEGSTLRGQAIAGIKAIEEFTPDRMEYLLNKASKSNRGKPLTEAEGTYIRELGKSLEALKSRMAAIDKQLEEKQSQRKPKEKKVSYLDKLEQAAENAKNALINKKGKLDFGNLKVEQAFEGQRGAIGEKKALPGDAETVAQVAAGRLHKVKTVTDLNKELVDAFGKEVEPYLPAIRKRAYEIRQEARLDAMKDASATTRRTILQDIKTEIAEAKREEQKALQEAVKSPDPATRRAAKDAIKRQQQEQNLAKNLMEAKKAERSAYQAEVAKKHEAERKANLWDTPIRKMAADARTALQNIDPHSPYLMEHLASVGAEKFLREQQGGAPGKRAISPAKFYREMQEEFPDLVTNKNREEVYKQSYQRITDTVTASREAAALRSASKESQRLWNEEGIDADEQALLILKAEATRKMMADRGAAAREFNRVNTSAWKRTAKDILNSPRMMMASLNMHMGRQGLLSLLTHPIKITAKEAIPATVKGFAASPEQFTKLSHEMRNSPGFDLAERSGLNISELPRTSTDLKGHIEEDELQSSLAMKIPWVRRSTQGFVLGMNAERLALFNMWADIGDAHGYTFETHPEFYKGVAKVANDYTGRGVAPEAVEKLMKGTNQIFFAPRLKVSQIMAVNDLFNPMKYIGKNSYDPVQRKIMAKEALRAVAGTTALYATLIALGGKGTDDPDDPDFFKVKFGHTHYDLTGGAGSTFMFAYKFFKNTGRYARGDELKPYEQPLELAKSFARKKLAPIPGSLIDWYTGKNAVGEPANFNFDYNHPVKTMKENIALKMVMPMIVNETMDGVMDDSWRGGLKSGIPAAFGWSEQTYAPRVFAAQKALDEAKASGKEEDIKIAEKDLEDAKKKAEEEKKVLTPQQKLQKRRDALLKKQEKFRQKIGQ